MAQFADAILEYVARENEAPDPTVKVHFFQNDFGVIYEYILVHWLAKVKDAEFAAYMVHSTSCIARAISKEKLQETVGRCLNEKMTLLEDQCCPRKSRFLFFLIVIWLQADRLLGIAVAVVRRNPHESGASEGLAIILDMLSSNAKSILEPQLDTLLDVIFGQVKSKIGWKIHKVLKFVLKNQKK